ncbi:MAG: hypothetical protein BGO49_03230 [Planctomycetales bacterium 71-10]|nr:MAG: hypothetical protein BGO49_03230 [Planctomycetales bacterium 71-10]
MFFNAGIRGDRMPRGTVCFTYDDGPGRTDSPEPSPGPRTGELGAYLRPQGVQAAFFAVGRSAERHQEILDSLSSGGHLVANHTFDHPSLPAYVSRDGDVVNQIEKTDAAIRAYVHGPTIYFRPPCGDWRLKGQDRSNVAETLNRSCLARDHVGPVLWDVDAGDVGYWRDDRPADECAAAYLQAIESAGRGGLMHDSTADIESIRLRNRSLELARLLVPELRGAVIDSSGSTRSPRSPQRPGHPRS